MPLYNSVGLAAQAMFAGGVRHAIVQRGDATGDISHVAAALALATDYGVLVIDGTDTASKGAGIANNYVLHYRFAPVRVAYVPIPQPINAALNVARGTINGVTMHDLTFSTDIVRRGLGAGRRVNMAQLPGSVKGARGLVKPVLRGDEKFVHGPNHSAADNQLLAYLQAKGILFNQHVVILWGRTSGKQGGLHPEGDASTTGLIQIATRCRAEGWGVILAGAIAQTKAFRFPAGCVYLGEFWNDPIWPAGGDRTKQVRLFYLLKKELKSAAPHRSMVHVGMRSGGLDAYAFAGQAAIYIVAQPQVGSDNRMHDTITDFAAQSPKLTFERFVSTTAPKRKYAIASDNTWTNLVGARRAQEHYLAYKSTSKPGGGPLPRHLQGLQVQAEYNRQIGLRGFSATDLDALVNQIRGKLS